MPVTMAIILNDDRSVSVSGPLTDKMVCYGMLENARDVIVQYAAAQSENKIVPARLIPTLVPKA